MLSRLHIHPDTNLRSAPLRCACRNASALDWGADVGVAAGVESGSGATRTPSRTHDALCCMPSRTRNASCCTPSAHPPRIVPRDGIRDVIRGGFGRWHMVRAAGLVHS